MPGDLPVIAIVDDDIAARRAVARLLASRQYHAKQFASAEQYWTSAESSDAVCVLIDIDLGEGISGLELARAIKATQNAPPIIFMSGSANPAVRVQAFEIGCIAYLEKPCLTEELLAAIHKAHAGA